MRAGHLAHSPEGSGPCTDRLLPTTPFDRFKCIPTYAVTMTMLVAYDGRENTEKALDRAISEAVLHGEKLYILSVIPRGSETQADIDRTHSFADAALERAKAGGADAHVIVESGVPDTEILSAASRFGCETIFVGRSGKTSLDRVIMGSVSNSIVANAKCTVVVVQ